MDPEQQEELRRAVAETSARLRQRGVALTGRETSDELVTLLESVERFELAVESRGGDLMVDEGPHGVTREPTTCISCCHGGARARASPNTSVAWTRRRRR